jgi:hypothetical protein
MTHTGGARQKNMQKYDVDQINSKFSLNKFRRKKMNASERVNANGEEADKRPVCVDDACWDWNDMKIGKKKIRMCVNMHTADVNYAKRGPPGLNSLCSVDGKRSEGSDEGRDAGRSLLAL